MPNCRGGVGEGVEREPTLFAYYVSKSCSLFCSLSLFTTAQIFVNAHKFVNVTCSFQDLPGFQELIFEDFSRFILVDSIFEEVVLHSVMKDIMTGELRWMYSPYA